MWGSFRRPYPIYIDVEDNYYQAKAGKTAVTNAIKGFCEYLESKGYYVGIYASSNWFANYIDTPKLSEYDKWVANWGKTRPATPEGSMWQFGGETNAIRTNKVAGMVCDQNYAYKDYPEIIKEAGLNGFEKTTTTEPKKKTVDELAKEVLEGKWGNGADRKKRLTEAGYNYNEVQAKVNELVNPKKSVDAIAREVINGKWGNGADRKKRLTEAGYNYNEVQRRVNELL